MEVIVSKYAGACHGVSAALKTVRELVEKGRKVYTFGTLIHNRRVTESLGKSGVGVINSLDEIDSREPGSLIVLRSHGVPPGVYRALEEKNAEYVDCTCRDVKKIHSVVSESMREGRRNIIIGDADHPEIVGTAGHAGDDVIIIENEEQLNAATFDPSAKYTLTVQTTFLKEKYDLLVSEIKKKNLDINIYDTTCKSTVLRQREAAEIAGSVDHMLVIGDKNSSNTTKLYEICKVNCRNTFFIETIDEIELKNFSTDDKIGITAGASTPSEIIKEAIMVMSEFDNTVSNQSFEEMLDETFVTLHTGNVVKGTVIQVVNGEVSVNLGYKSDGIIPRSEFSDDPTLDPADVVKRGDVIDVFVVRVNDSDGNVMLSKKKIDMGRNYDLLEEAFNNKTALPGKVIDVVKGGLIALIGGIRVFVPSSQASNRYVEDLSRFKGKEFNFNILEFDKNKRRFVAGRKVLAGQEQVEKKEKVFSALEVGAQVTGTVSRIVDFGAFVDLGGVDGLIHISELSWGRVKKVRDMLQEGDTVKVTVLDMDKNKGKISLSLKDMDNDPWRNVVEKCPVGSVIEGKVVRMVPFGAFVELDDGVDGLVHISQIASKHVVRPEDELKIGQIIKAKVTDIDLENKRISLSKKEADAMYVGSLGAASDAEIVETVETGENSAPQENTEAAVVEEAVTETEEPVNEAKTVDVSDVGASVKENLNEEV